MANRKAWISQRDDQWGGEHEVRLERMTVDLYFTERFADLKFMHNGRKLSDKRRDIILRAFPDILQYIDAKNARRAEDARQRKSRIQREVLAS